MKKRILKALKILLITYLLVGLAVYWLQDRILFHPVSLRPGYKYNFQQPHRDVTMQLDSATLINVIEFTTRDTVKGVVLYFHGNKKNISWYARYADNFTKRGYEVWMIDYPGYGKSIGRFTEQDLYRYADALYQLAQKRFKSQTILVFGKSMGTGIATQLASTHPCQQLILETPYYSFTSLGKHYLPIYPVSWLLHYKMPTYQFLPSVKVPVTIFHGTDDWVIPYHNALRLKPLLKSTDAFITIPNGGHNDLNNFPLFQRKLDSLLRN
jgi:pimeloyl-ACP methyl ester carboxylesterase